MSNKRYILDVQEDNNGEQFIEFPEELLKETGWREGDLINWTEEGKNSWRLKKVDEQVSLVLVETVTVTRQQYLVKTPVGKEDWALDSIVCLEANSFDKTFLDEVIVSHRAVTGIEKEEYLSNRKIVKTILDVSKVPPGMENLS